MKSRAAVAFGPGKPLEIVEIDVELRISEHRDRPFRLIVTGHFANA